MGKYIGIQHVGARKPTGTREGGCTGSTVQQTSTYVMSAVDLLCRSEKALKKKNQNKNTTIKEKTSRCCLSQSQKKYAGIQEVRGPFSWPFQVICKWRVPLSISSFILILNIFSVAGHSLDSHLLTKWIILTKWNVPLLIIDNDRVHICHTSVLFISTDRLFFCLLLEPPQFHYVLIMQFKQLKPSHINLIQRY